MNDHAARKFACGREMGNNEFFWSGLTLYEFLQSMSCISHSPKGVVAKSGAMAL